jgi:hypothetical protein
MLRDFFSMPDKRYVLFTHKEWELMEKLGGRVLKPADIKLLLASIYKGELLVTRPKPKAKPKKKSRK